MASFFQSVFITVVIAVVLRFFVIQPFVVEGASMEPNFHDQQYIMIDKLSYHMRAPARGEVIVFHPPTAPDQNYIKRIIGLPGETIRVENREVFVNANKVNEPYLGTEEHNTDKFALSNALTLGQDEYFVMGDNRSHSSDSREWGVLKRDAIEGRTWFVLFPTSSFHFITKPSYNFSFLTPQSPSNLALGH